jgi:hypothetical protein
MLHIATTHLRSPRWIEIQARHLREHISVPYLTWGSLQLIDDSYRSYFDRIIEQKGPEPGKLNHLAVEIAEEALDSDLLMFIAGDAFPIADPMPAIEQALSGAPLLAARRLENAGNPQPHPCFCVTSVGAWRGLAGDWSDGYAWHDEQGALVTDIGANLLRRLELTRTPWVELLRSNSRTLDPLSFALYAGVIYHHGAGTDALSPADRGRAPKPLPVPRVRGLDAAFNQINGGRHRAWERRTRRRRLRRSEAIYEKIQRGDTRWLAEIA